jgi:hypothetical protein
LLNGSIPWEVEVRGGASNLVTDFDELNLGSLEIKGGASQVKLKLPPPTGTIPLRVLGGADGLIVHRPNGVAARVRVSRGASGLVFDEQSHGAVGGETSLQSPDYEHAADRYDIEVSGGVSGLTIEAT